MSNPNYWSQFRNRKEILDDEAFERHQDGECEENCRFCKEKNDMDKPEPSPADYYRHKREEAERLTQELAEAEARGASLEKRLKLKSKLELARYVGD